MRRQIPGCPIKHIEMSLSYFLSLLHLFITVLLSSYLFSLFHFLAILFLLYLPLLCVCECPSLILPPLFLSLCDDRWCVGEKLNISSEIGFLWRNWWITLCSWREYKGLFMPCRQMHEYTHTHIHPYTYARVRGREDCLCWSRMNFYES